MTADPLVPCTVCGHPQEQHKPEEKGTLIGSTALMTFPAECSACPFGPDAHPFKEAI